MSRVYFTDRDLGKQFPAILRAAGLVVEAHSERFAPDGKDEQWLEYCGTKGRIAITHNKRIRYTPNELSAVREHRVALLIVIGAVPFADLAHNFVRTLPRVEQFLSTHQPPFIAKIKRPAPSELARNAESLGSILQWHP